tara:strand:+ start:268 stop:1557 length:1290 start_codon:yes stop_codon:yes gene_type:complete
MQCPICIEKITPSKKVTCQLCEYTVCSKCTQTYLLSSADDANCMNCKRIWDRETLLKLMSKTFINGEYKRHRENMLLERETAMMTSTQPYVEQEIQRRKNVKLLTKLQEERNNLKRKLMDLNRACWDVQNNLDPPLENEKRSFVHKCGKEGCNGFLSLAWKCNICHMYTCSECNVLKGQDRDSPHVCNENDKLTMQMLKKDSKKCPGCASYIYKIDGCDQMWCVTCHTAFSWRTGLIVNGTVHNPHYYEFQRNHATLRRALGDIPCGGMPTYREFAITFTNRNKSIEFDFCIKLHRIVNHIEHIELPRYTHVVNETNNLDLRVKYMMNEISTDLFKSKIQQREKASQKKRDIGMILNMFVTTMSDYYRTIIYEKSFHYTKDLKELVNYTNKSLLTLSERYECVVPIIDFNNEIFRIKSVTYKIPLTPLT